MAEDLPSKECYLEDFGKRIVSFVGRLDCEVVRTAKLRIVQRTAKTKQKMPSLKGRQKKKSKHSKRQRSENL